MSLTTREMSKHYSNYRYSTERIWLEKGDPALKLFNAYKDKKKDSIDKFIADYRNDIYRNIPRINESYAKMREESMEAQKRKEDAK